jgi:hypothetical protein
MGGIGGNRRGRIILRKHWSLVFLRVRHMCPHHKRHVSETSHVAAVGSAIGSANDDKASSQNIYIKTCSFS